MKVTLSETPLFILNCPKKVVFFVPSIDDTCVKGIFAVLDSNVVISASITPIAVVLAAVAAATVVTSLCTTAVAAAAVAPTTPILTPKAISAFFKSSISLFTPDFQVL